MKTIPRNWLVAEYYLNGDATDSAWNNNWIATNITWPTSNIGYQSKLALWWASSSLTYSSITYTTSVIWKDGNMLINSNEVTATALNWVSGSTYLILRFYDRILSDDEIQTLYLEWLQKLTPEREAYPKLFDWLVWYRDFRDGDLSNLVDWTLATNNGATLTTDHLGYSNNAYNTVWDWKILLSTVIPLNWVYTISSTFRNDTMNIWTSWSSLTSWSNADHQIIVDISWNLWFFSNWAWTFNSSWYVIPSDWLTHFITAVADWINTNFYIDWQYVWQSSWVSTDNIYSLLNYQGNGQHWWIWNFVIVHNRTLSASEVKTLYDLIKK